jgi:methylenetetrahydrofolate reductase (NADPH)
MRVTEIWKTKGKPTVSFEVYPAKTPKAIVNLEKALDNLVKLEPDFFSVTFGAGGSTREGSWELVRKLRQDKNAEVLAYVACFGLPPQDLEGIIDGYRELGVETILTVRGDKPRDQDGFSTHPDSFPHATDFLRFAKPRFDLCVGAACYPEGHIEAESKKMDMEYLKQKVDLGAEFLITNYFYDNHFYFDFIDRCNASGIHVPIVPGVMPIFSIKMMENLARLCGATISDELRNALTRLSEDDKDAVVKFGVDHAADQCRELLESNVPGLHFYTMDRSKSTTEILHRLRSENLL